MLREDALAGVEPGASVEGGDVQQDTARDDAVAEGGDGVVLGALLGVDEVGGLAVVHLAVPEDVAEAVEVGDGDAVEGEAHDLEGGTAPSVLEGVAAGGDHVALGGAEHVIGAGGGLDVPGAGDGDALADKGGGFEALRGRYVVQGAELVVGAPAAPVGERVEVAENLGLGGRMLLAGHGVPPGTRFAPRRVRAA